MTDTSALECRALAVGRGGAAIVDGIEFALPEGQTLALLGASGSGKTTLLDTIAGFIPPVRGEIRLAGRVVSDLRRCEPPERRSVGVVFQQYALWPHMSVLDIVGYPARRAGTSRAASRKQALDLLDRLGIGALADRRPTELSGGEQQRVALARALARRPTLFLFDEPTAHLDAHLRGLVLDEVARHRAESGAAALYATHDAAEALAIADMVAVVDDGRLAQVGTPAEVYQQPATLSVARLAGPACVLDAVARQTGPASVEVAIGDADATVACARLQPGSPLLVRPDWVTLGGPFDGVVANVRFRGPHTEYSLDTPAGSIQARAPGPPQHHVGERLNWSLSRVWSLPDATPAPRRPEPDTGTDRVQDASARILQ